MSPKDLLYLEDALGHTKFLFSQCQEACNTLQDGALKKRAGQMQNKHRQLYESFYQTM